MASFEFSVPVLIAGAGAAGVVAGLAAAEAGRDVLLIEQDAAPSGSTGISQGLICAAGSAAQRRVGVEDSAELLLDDILAKTRGQTDVALARAISAASGSCMDWLIERHDVPLSLDVSYRAGFGHSRPRLHGWAGYGGLELLNLLHDRLSNAGGQLLLQATLTEILVDGGKVIGAEFARPGGERDRIGCEALILACGGFAGNPAMVATHMPEAAAALYNGHEGSRGDAIELARGLGAATADMGSYQGYGLLTTPYMITAPPALVLEGAFLVNESGARFADETADVTGLIHPVLAQPNGQAWLIYDAGIEALCGAMPELRQLDELGAARCGDTLEAIAAATGVTAEVLAKEFQDLRNAADAAGGDRVGRSWRPRDVPKPPYRALKVTGALYHTQGGLAVDTCMRVVAGPGRTLHGLYAAGGSARSLSGPSFWGYLPAMGLGGAIAGGAIAGRAATDACA